MDALAAAATSAGALIGTGSAALAGKLVYDVVGPTAKNLGDILRDHQDYRLRNWMKIGAAAHHIRPDVPADFSVHPRVAQRVIDDSTWLDDDVMQAYAGGILAASRTADGKNDSGAFYVDMLNSMTAVQVSLHHVLYWRVRELLQGGADIASSAAMRVALPVSPLLSVLYDDPTDRPIQSSHLREAIAGLAREGLVNSWTITGRTGTEPGTSYLNDWDLTCDPSTLGIGLFLWAHGVESSIASDMTLDMPEFEVRAPRL